jgi:hypothetical protein
MLTVMTLVSRPSISAHPEKSARKSRDGEEPTRDKRDAREVSAEARAFAQGASTVTSHPDDGVNHSLISSISSISGTHTNTDETPGTQDSLRMRTRIGPPSRGRLVLLSAALGIVLAVGLVIGLEVSGEDPPERTPPATVSLFVSSTPPGARAIVAGREKVTPATFDVLQGDVLTIAIELQGYADEVRRVAVPRDASEHRLEVPLRGLETATPDAGAAAALDAGQGAVDAGAALAVVPPAVVDAGVAEAARDAGADKPDKPIIKKNVPKKPGTLKVVLRGAPEAELFVDGKRLGDLPMRPLELAAGKHRVAALLPNGKKIGREIVIKPGETELVTFEF